MAKDTTSKLVHQKIQDFAVSANGSLGLLALGAKGLKIWRDQKAMAESANKTITERKINVKK